VGSESVMQVELGMKGNEDENRNAPPLALEISRCLYRFDVVSCGLLFHAFATKMSGSEGPPPTQSPLRHSALLPIKSSNFVDQWINQLLLTLLA